MTLRRWVPVLMLALSGCAHLSSPPSDTWERAQMWDEAHGYLATGEFGRADSVFAALATAYPETDEGRESLFYRGALALDPRNPDWSSEVAEQHLQQYLAAGGTEEARIHRRPEGEVFFELAHQLNLPMEERISSLRVEPQTRVIIQAREAEGALAENAALRQQLLASQDSVQRLKEELERIRRTLTGGQ